MLRIISSILQKPLHERAARVSLFAAYGPFSCMGFGHHEYKFGYFQLSASVMHVTLHLFGDHTVPIRVPAEGPSALVRQLVLIAL